MHNPAEALLIPRGRYSNEMRSDHVTRRDLFFFGALENLLRRLILSRHFNHTRCGSGIRF